MAGVNCRLAGDAVVTSWAEPLSCHPPATGDGTEPLAGLLNVNGTLYGTTQSGGRSGYGTGFRVNTDGTGYTVLKHFSGTTYDPSTGSFTNTDGAEPSGLDRPPHRTR